MSAPVSTRKDTYIPNPKLHISADDLPVVMHLHEKGRLTAQQMKAAEAEHFVTQERLTNIMVRNGFLRRSEAVEAILLVAPEKIEGESQILYKVPGSIIRDLRIMIVAETPDAVYLSTTSPEHLVRAELDKYFGGAEFKFVPFSESEFEEYMEKVEKMSGNDGNMMENLFRKAQAMGASDLHIIPRATTYTVMFRILGVRQIVYEGKLEEYATLCARIKDQSRMDLAERRVPQDGAMQMDYNGKLIDLRVATVPTLSGEYIVIRILDADRIQPNLDLLGITNVKDWRQGVSRPDGLCVICGPTGSGKTTTLNASLRELDRFGRAIFSIEDPVEYRIAYTGQTNANHLLGLDFARAVKAFMRSDPDIIILGEIRDDETARNAIKAAETGHLVLGTLHTGSVYGAVTRFRDLGVEAHELRYLLRTVMAQRLIRTKCPVCKGSGKYKELDCQNCKGSGFAGRTLVTECAYFSGEADVDRMLAGQKWWDTMLVDACKKAIVEDVTTEEEVIRTFGAEAQKVFDYYRKTGKVPTPDTDYTEEA